MRQGNNKLDGYMTTNFALSLSADGIRLLHRVKDGWHLVGETGLDVPDLSAQLAKLRDMALKLDPSGMRTKLLIPADQIKFVTLDTAQTELADVIAALENATPYAVDELVIDFDRNGGRTFIAAVARETLAEAEAFAIDHDFAPVAFAAIAEPMTFQSEVFFGPTAGAAKITDTPVVRDAVPVVVTGKVTPPKPAVPPAQEEPLFTPRTRMADPESVAKPAPKPEIDPVKPAPQAKPQAPDDPEVLFTRRQTTQPLAVPTGDAKGPAITQPSNDAPTGPVKPVTTALREPTIAPVVTRVQKNPPPVPTPAPMAETQAPKADEMAAIGGFVSGRAAPVVEPRAAPADTPKPAKKAATPATKPTRGKPRFLGLILTAILLLAMALVALWAAGLSEEDVAGWFGKTSGSVMETAATQDPTVAAEDTATQVIAVAPQAQDAAVPTADPTPATDIAQTPATEIGRVLSPAEALRIYAATGVWQRAPRLPVEPRTDTLTTVMPVIEPAHAAISLPLMPDMASAGPDLVLLAPINPPALGTAFPRDENGFVIATPEGTITPQGALVFAGPPTIRPPLRPTTAVTAPAALIETTDVPEGVVLVSGKPSIVPPLRPAAAALAATPEPEVVEDAPVVTAGGVALAGLRPSLRPDALAPASQDIVALADPALADARPKLRPAGLAPAVAAVAEPTPEAAVSPDISAVVAAIAQATPTSPYVAATARAVETSRRPGSRPQNFARVVSRATDLASQQTARAATPAPAAQQAPAPAPTTSVSGAAVRPTGPVSGGVARAATDENAIKLRNMNLIGVYGRPSDRRALIRLGNGRYVKVQVGSGLDGGQVTAIGDNALNYVKRGKTYALQLPTG